MTDGDQGRALPAALHRLREAVQAVPLTLQVPGADRARAEQRELLEQLRSYLLPRSVALDTPLLAVVGGSTGAGKSTLVNSVVGESIARAGVIRPTTTSSTLIHHPDDTRWFRSDKVLPGFVRHTGQETEGDPGSLRLVQCAQVPRGLALLDAPDIDSVVAGNKELAGQLLSAADLWIFVTTAVRYADAVPWEFLHRAIARGTAVAVVLNRVPVDAMEEVRADLAGMLSDQGMVQSPVFALVETKLAADGLLPVTEVARIRSWLHSLASDAHARRVVIRGTFEGTLDSLSERCGVLEEGMRRQVEAATALRAVVDEAFTEALDSVRLDIRRGALLRGEVLARWQEFVGTGELLRQLGSDEAGWRDKLGGIVRGRTKAQSAEGLRGAVRSGAATLMRSHADDAAQRIAQGWRERPEAGALQDDPDLSSADSAFGQQAEEAVGQWQDDVMSLVRDAAGNRRTTARFMAFGADGIAAMVMMTTLDATDADAAPPTGSVLLARRLLEAVFGTELAKSLVDRAREKLFDVARAAYARESERFGQALDGQPSVGGDSSTATIAKNLKEALAAVEEAR